MDDEKKLMNCVTYSLGELAAQWQRPQMRVLESHLRLVNVLTESLNELQQYQLIEHNRCFRPSVAKKVRIQKYKTFLEDVGTMYHQFERFLFDIKLHC